MKKYQTTVIEKAKERLKMIKPSHNEAWKVKEGWQTGMYEKEVTNYDGFGMAMRVYGRTPEEAEAMALIVCRKISLGLDTIEGGDYDGIHTFFGNNEH